MYVYTHIEIYMYIHSTHIYVYLYTCIHICTHICIYFHVKKKNMYTCVAATAAHSGCREMQRVAVCCSRVAPKVQENFNCVCEMLIAVESNPLDNFFFFKFHCQNSAVCMRVCTHRTWCVSITTAVWCSVLQCVDVYIHRRSRVPHTRAVCCAVLQCIYTDHNVFCILKHLKHAKTNWICQVVKSENSCSPLEFGEIGLCTSKVIWHLNPEADDIAYFSVSLCNENVEIRLCFVKNMENGNL